MNQRPPFPLRSGLTALVACLALPQLSVQAAEQEETRLDTVSVISTGLRGQQRTVADSPAPIDIINSEQLLKTGRAELSEAISKLLPSFNFGTNIAGVNSQVRPLSNRGLGPAYTLVLVNGKRRHNGAAPANGSIDTSGANAVDIDMIPISAVDHIEVLKDSAGKRVTGVVYTNVLNGEEFEQPASMVLLTAYAINNVHLMLLSGLGQPYDPASQKGVIGKNYCYQTGAAATLFFESRKF